MKYMAVFGKRVVWMFATVNRDLDVQQQDRSYH